MTGDLCEIETLPDLGTEIKRRTCGISTNLVMFDSK